MLSRSNTFTIACGSHIIWVAAGVAELADAADLKSAGAILVGSSPTPGTRPTTPGPAERHSMDDAVTRYIE